MNHAIERYFTRVAAIVFTGLIAYLPFHIFISTVIGVNIGGLEALKASKDIVIILIALLLLPYCWLNKKIVTKLLTKDYLNILCLVYIGINILFFLINHRDIESAGLGLIYNTRFIILFLLARLLAMAHPSLVNSRKLVRIVVLTSIAVAVVGLLQFFILPDDFFARLGYSMASGALPWFYIDDKPDYLRIMSTMRDPNSLGSYLLIAISILLANIQLKKVTTDNSRNKIIVSIIVLVSALLLAFSRSAILGLVVTVVCSGVIGGRLGKKINSRRIAKYGALFILIMGTTGLIFMKASPRNFKNIVLHADEETVLRDPNELRVDFLYRSAKQISRQPLGYGLGSAGLASMKNKQTGVNLTENYYLQLAIEIGVVGLIVFLAVCWLLIKRIYKSFIKTKSYIGLALLASFAGLFITNMLAHIWTNETIAITWWSLAAVFITQSDIEKPDLNRRKAKASKWLKN